MSIFVILKARDNIIMRTLTQIANIQTGIYTKSESFGEIMYLQVKHFDENGVFISTFIPDLSLNPQIEKHLLLEGDILFAAKGTKNFAVKYDNKIGRCVASSTFLIIKIKKEFHNSIASDFICWYLNHPKTQEILKSKARGSSMPSISKVDLMELELKIPSFEKQNLIIKIAFLQKKEQNIYKKLEQIKDKYIQNSLISAINN